MRILFVESDRDLRIFFGTKLKDEFNGTIDIASTGKDAMKLLKTERPYHVIIADYNLSKGTGVDLFRFKIRNQIHGSFIFFGFTKEAFYCSTENYLQVDKPNFGLLCQRIREALSSRFL